MSNEKVVNGDKLTKILIAAITEPASPAKMLLEGAKKEIKSDDVRFRIRDWQDQSVVYVPNWIIGEMLEKAEPELAQRVYFDPEDHSRMDCVVGLVARIARIKEEEANEKRDNELIQHLKDGVSEDEIVKPRISFNDVKEDKVYNNFIRKLEEGTRIWLEKKEKWEKYSNDLKELNKGSESFFSEAFDQQAPWKNEKYAKKKEEQWTQLKEYLIRYKRGDEVKEFIKVVDKTTDRYNSLYMQWEKYTQHAQIPRCEIAVPVVAFGKFLGVLNFHRENEFTENDEHLARTFATQLAVVCLQRQTEVFEEFQKVARLMAAENNFEVIASKIAEGIRTGLRDGLKKNEVFPLLYVANQPITRFDELFDNLNSEPL